nr:transporter [Pantoea vagans]
MNNFFCRTGISLAAVLSLPADALEFSPGDYEMMPADKTFALAYFQYAHSDKYYSQGNKAAGDYRLRTEATLLRFIHGFRPAENISIEPQIIIPFVRANAMGDASPLGSASGMGDIIMGMPFKFRMDNTGGTFFHLHRLFMHLPEPTTMKGLSMWGKTAGAI